MGEPKDIKIDEPKFLISCCTEDFGSEEYINAVKNKIKLTRDQLVEEDKYQLK